MSVEYVHFHLKGPTFGESELLSEDDTKALQLYGREAEKRKNTQTHAIFTTVSKGNLWKGSKIQEPSDQMLQTVINILSPP